MGLRNIHRVITLLLHNLFHANLDWLLRSLELVRGQGAEMLFLVEFGQELILASALTTVSHIKSLAISAQLSLELWPILHE